MIIEKDIPIEKGFKLTKQVVDNNLDNLKDVLEYFLNYPDIFLDWIKPHDSNFTLYFYQRIFLRVNIRFSTVYTVAPRAFSKSFISVLSGILRCIFLPESKFFICLPGKGQSVNIVSQKIEEILNIYPLLKKEILKKHESNDYYEIIFNNGSTFEAMGELNSNRGLRKTRGIIDEDRDHDSDLLNAVILPLLNVSRRCANGDIDFTEPNQAKLYITSASDKGSECYQRAIDTLIDSIISPEDYFFWGMDYRIPAKHGLISQKYINSLKLQSTFKEADFAREYLSIFVGASEDAWISYDKLDKCRVLVNSEKNKKTLANSDSFYYISVDVARTGSARTSIMVFKVIPTDTYFRKKLIYLVSMQGQHNAIQAIEIKKLIRDFSPKEVAIDTTGLGTGLMDFMVLTQFDDKTGEVLPAYISINHPDYMKMEGIPLIYNLIANEKINSEMHSNLYTQIDNGYVDLLIGEQEAKEKMLRTQAGKKLPAPEKIKRMSPYMETSSLISEICNLKIKNSGNDIKVERINKRMEKDRFSSFEIGLYRIKIFETSYYKKRQQKKIDYKKLMMFTKRR